MPYQISIENSHRPVFLKIFLTGLYQYGGIKSRSYVSADFDKYYREVSQIQKYNEN